MMNQSITLGQRIYRLRRERGLSQEDLAEALNVSRQSVSKWETDGSVPDLDKLMGLSDLFGVSLDELVKGVPSDRDVAATWDDRKDAESAADILSEDVGGEEPAETAPPMIAPAETPPTVPQAPARSPRPYRKAGYIFLIVGALWGIFLLLIGVHVGGIVQLISPLLVCGVTCLLVRRYPVLWCGWWLTITITSVLSTYSVIRFYNFDLVTILYTLTRAGDLPANLRPNPIGVLVHVVVSAIVLTLMAVTVTLYSRIPIQWNRKSCIRCGIIAAVFLVFHVLYQVSLVESQIYLLGENTQSALHVFLASAGSLMTHLSACMRVLAVTAVATRVVFAWRRKK